MQCHTYDIWSQHFVYLYIFDTNNTIRCAPPECNHVYNNAYINVHLPLVLQLHQILILAPVFAFAD